MPSGSLAIILLSTETSALRGFSRVFLAGNKVEINFERADAVKTMLALAAGDLGEEEVADWFRDRIAPA